MCKRANNFTATYIINSNSMVWLKNLRFTTVPCMCIFCQVRVIAKESSQLILYRTCYVYYKITLPMFPLTPNFFSFIM
jgi:hypothetical protein